MQLWFALNDDYVAELTCDLLNAGGNIGAVCDESICRVSRVNSDGTGREQWPATNPNVG